MISTRVKFLKGMLTELGIVNAEGKLSVTIERNSKGQHIAAVAKVNLLTEEQQNELNNKNEWLSIANFKTTNISVIRY